MPEYNPRGYEDDDSLRSSTATRSHPKIGEPARSAFNYKLIENHGSVSIYAVSFGEGDKELHQGFRARYLSEGVVKEVVVNGPGHKKAARKIAHRTALENFDWESQGTMLLEGKRYPNTKRRRKNPSRISSRESYRMPSRPNSSFSLYRGY